MKRETGKMNKKLIIINGPMGVGKTTVCRDLLKKTTRAVWLDGDWCWMMNPWVFSDANKQMVIDNITYLLRNFLRNPSFDFVIFDWVIHRPEIFDLILDGLTDLEPGLLKITLLCSEEALRERMRKDRRTLESIEDSVGRLKFYQLMDTVKIDTSQRTIPEVVAKIQEIIR